MKFDKRYCVQLSLKERTMIIVIVVNIYYSHLRNESDKVRFTKDLHDK